MMTRMRSVLFLRPLVCSLLRIPVLLAAFSIAAAVVDVKKLLLVLFFTLLVVILKVQSHETMLRNTHSTAL